MEEVSKVNVTWYCMSKCAYCARLNDDGNDWNGAGFYLLNWLKDGVEDIVTLR